MVIFEINNLTFTVNCLFEFWIATNFLEKESEHLTIKINWSLI